MQPEISNLRQTYHLGSLRREQLDEDPFRQFGIWFSQAHEAGIAEPNAMVLSTSTPQGLPSSRVVLLKDVNDQGFSFYTNFKSRKGNEIDTNPHVSLLFLWLPLERQVRIEGVTHRISDAEADAYFRSRPEGSRLGAWASEQSSIIPGREVLDKRLNHFRQTWPDGNIPRPEHWGGYRVVPQRFEFWQGRDNRLHDRFLYSRNEGNWQVDRLAP